MAIEYLVTKREIWQLLRLAALFRYTIPQLYKFLQKYNIFMT
jgi:hypothetical protein